MKELPRLAGKFAHVQRILHALVMLDPHSFLFDPLVYILVLPFTFSLEIAARDTEPKNIDKESILLASAVGRHPHEWIARFVHRPGHGPQQDDTEVRIVEGEVVMAADRRENAPVPDFPGPHHRPGVAIEVLGGCKRHITL